MALKLHGLIGSPAAFRVMATLYEKDLDFDFIPVDFASREQKTPQFLARNPFGEIPVFEDGDLTLFESRAITMYIVATYADKGTDLVSKNPKESAIETVWMEVESQKFDPASSRLNWELIFKPMNGKTTDEAVVARFEKKLESVLDVYERRLTECKYLGGDSFSLADLHHLPNLHYLMATKVKTLIHARPHVSAWASDIFSRPAWLKVSALLPK